MPKKKPGAITQAVLAEAFADLGKSLAQIKGVYHAGGYPAARPARDAEMARLKREYPGFVEFLNQSPKRGRPKWLPNLTPEREPLVTELSDLYARLLRSINHDYRALLDETGDIEISLGRLRKQLASTKSEREFSHKANWVILKKALKESRRFSPKSVAAEIVSHLVRGPKSDQAQKHLLSQLVNRKLAR
jgi:hypothetical protein